MRKLVFFFLANDHIGGVETLFIRLIKQLKGRCELYLLTGENTIFHKFLTNEDVTFLKFNLTSNLLPSDATVILPLNYPNVVGLLNGKNIRFLFWGLYERSVLCIESFRFIHLLENKFKLNITFKFEKLLMMCFGWMLYKRLKQFFKVADEKNGLMYMEAGHINFNEEYFNIKLKQNILPLAVYVPQQRTMLKIFDKNDIKIAWIGRFVGFKYTAIKSIIENINIYCKNNPTTTISLYLIGCGPLESKIKHDCSECRNNNFVPTFAGEMYGDDLTNFLTNNIDLVCAHGTSVLDGAKHTIPSLIVTGGFNEVRDYLWLFDAPYGYIGSMLSNPKGINFSEALSMLIKDNNDLSIKSYNHVNYNFNVTKIADQLLEKVDKNTLKLQDIQHTKITKHTFWIKLIQWIRSRKR